MEDDSKARGYIKAPYWKMETPDDDNINGVRQLAASIFDRALRDLGVCTDTRQREHINEREREEALKWVFIDNVGFNFWCSVLDLSTSDMRQHIDRLLKRPKRRKERK